MAEKGRPAFKWTEEIENEIFGLLITGKSINSILGKDRANGLPGPDTFYKRLANDKDFSEKYARVAEIRERVIFEEILNIADTQEIGTIETVKEWGVEVKTADMIEHRRLQIDARKWMLGKMAPKKYGEKLELAGDQSAPLTIVVKDYAGNLDPK